MRNSGNEAKLKKEKTSDLSTERKKRNIFVFYLLFLSLFFLRKLVQKDTSSTRKRDREGDRQKDKDISKERD